MDDKIYVDLSEEAKNRMDEVERSIKIDLGSRSIISAREYQVLVKEEKKKNSNNGGKRQVI